jgi:DNA-binding transcriptional LysR family regulator
MDLRLLEYFLAVVDHGGITKAAEALYIAQPSLSQAIRSLERELGVDLFDRSGRRLTLTGAGESLAVAARRIGHDVDQARAEVQAVRDLASGRLEVAATPTLEIDPLPELASRMRREYPGILLSVLIPGGAAQVLHEVRQGRAELGLTELPDRADALHACPLETQEITLVLPPGIAADLPDPVPLAALAGVPLVTTDAGTTTMPETNAQIAVECAHRPAVWELVRQGAGATFLPRRLAERHLRDVVVRSLSPRVERSTGLVFRPGPVSPAARAFLSIAGVSIAGVAKLPGRAD